MLEAARWSYLALLAWQGVWWGWLNPPELFPATVAVSIAVVPLLLFLPGVWKQSPRTLVVAGCILLAYFSVGVMEWWAGAATRAGGIVQTGLTLVYFATLTVGLRRRH